MDVLDVVRPGDFERSSGCLHEVCFSECGELSDSGSISDDCDGLIVTESCDVESHVGFVMFVLLDFPIDGGFDEFEWD